MRRSGEEYSPRLGEGTLAEIISARCNISALLPLPCRRRCSANLEETMGHVSLPPSTPWAEKLFNGGAHPENEFTKEMGAEAGRLDQICDCDCRDIDFGYGIHGNYSFRGARGLENTNRRYDCTYPPCHRSPCYHHDDTCSLLDARTMRDQGTASQDGPKHIGSPPNMADCTHRDCEGECTREKPPLQSRQRHRRLILETSASTSAHGTLEIGTESIACVLQLPHGTCGYGESVKRCASLKRPGSTKNQWSGTTRTGVQKRQTVLIGMLKYESLREGGLALSSLFLEDETGEGSSASFCVALLHVLQVSSQHLYSTVNMMFIYT